jgi:HEAT repeat protein
VLPGGLAVSLPHWSVPSRSEWGLTPGQSIELECGRRGTARVVAGCIDLLGGQDADDALVIALAGPPARYVLDTGPAPVHRYWLRVWGARGLLYAWDDTARPAVLAALADEAWRVREMAAKVVARHLIGEALDAVAELRHDPVARVRQAATRAVTLLTAAGA